MSEMDNIYNEYKRKQKFSLEQIDQRFDQRIGFSLSDVWAELLPVLDELAGSNQLLKEKIKSLEGHKRVLAASHKIVMFHKLGIIKHLKETLPGLHENTNAFAGLLGLLTGSTTESVRHNLRYVEGKTTDKNKNPETITAISNIRATLKSIGLDQSEIDKFFPELE